MIEVEEAVSLESNALETAATGDGSGGEGNAGGELLAREAQPGEVDAGDKTSATSVCDGRSPPSSVAGASSPSSARFEAESEGGDVLEAAGTTKLIIPTFDMTPTATAVRKGWYGHGVLT